MAWPATLKSGPVLEGFMAGTSFPPRAAPGNLQHLTHILNFCIFSQPSSAHPREMASSSFILASASPLLPHPLLDLLYLLINILVPNTSLDSLASFCDIISLSSFVQLKREKSSTPLSQGFPACRNGPTVFSEHMYEMYLRSSVEA